MCGREKPKPCLTSRVMCFTGHAAEVRQGFPLKIGPQSHTARRTTKRPDPTSREVDGLLPFRTLLNKDPSKHYVLVHEADNMQGPAYYQMMGYQFVIARPNEKDSERIGGIVGDPPNEGDKLRVMGDVWMWIDGYRRKQIEEWGIDGNGGLNLADELDERMGKLNLSEAQGRMSESHGMVVDNSKVVAPKKRPEVTGG